jgi:23S rRNA pseudouridine1911/1915/1917 synthase
MRDNDLLVHRTTRVEPPILDLDVKVIKEDEDFLCVNKPPGITIHTGGGYHYNTLLALMFFELKETNLFVLHRLDKCTSGVILFAKNK